MAVDEEYLESRKEIEIITIKNFIVNEINTLNFLSQSIHNNYLVLQGAEYKCLEAVAMLSL